MSAMAEKKTHSVTKSIQREHPNVQSRGKLLIFPNTSDNNPSYGNTISKHVSVERITANKDIHAGFDEVAYSYPEKEGSSLNDREVLSEIRQTRNELYSEIKDTRRELREELKEVKGEIKSREDSLATNIDSLSSDIGDVKIFLAELKGQIKLAAWAIPVLVTVLTFLVNLFMKQ